MLDNVVLKYKSNPRAQQMSKIGGAGLSMILILWLVMQAMSGSEHKQITPGLEKVDTSFLDPRNQDDPFEKEGLVRKIEELTEQVKKGSTAYDVRINELQEGMKSLDKENTELRNEVGNTQRSAEDKFNDKFEILAKQFRERLDDLGEDSQTQRELSEQIMARLPNETIIPPMQNTVSGGENPANQALPAVSDEYASLVKKYQRSKESDSGVSQTAGVEGLQAQNQAGKPGGTTPPNAAPPKQGFNFAVVTADGESPVGPGSGNNAPAGADKPDGKEPKTAAGKKIDEKLEAEKKEAEARDKGIFIPAGSLLQGVLITGVDAPTGVKADAQPHPVLIRIKKEAILPSRFRANLRDCFVIGGATAKLNTGRVYIRSERISCIRNDGGVIEAPMASYASGEDSKIGLSGRIVSKQGSLIARSIMAGFLSGVADAFKPQEVPVLVDSYNTNTQYQQPSAGDVATISAYNGISVAAEKVADYYLALADDLPPVVELNGGRAVELVLMQGVQLAVK
jgi:conjugal transfer pilus assembly protein TraB